MGITRRAISDEIRERRKKEKEERKKRAIALHNSGYSIDKIANEIEVKPSTVRSYLREWRRESYSTYSISRETQDFDGALLFLYFLKSLIIILAFILSFVRFGFGGGLLVCLVLLVFTFFRMSNRIGKIEFYFPLIIFDILVLSIKNISLIQGLELIFIPILFITLPVAFLTRKGYRRYLP